MVRAAVSSRVTERAGHLLDSDRERRARHAQWLVQVPWVDRVPSKSNPADVPSTMQFDRISQMQNGHMSHTERHQ